MGTVVFYAHSGFTFPSCFAFSKQVKLGIPLYSLKDGPLAYASWKDVLQSNFSSTKSDRSVGSRPPRKSHAPERMKKKGDSKKSSSSDGELPKLSNQEEIIALLRRIQTSISNGESTSTKKRNENLSGVKSPNKAMVRRSRKQVKETTTSREKDKVLTGKGGVPEKDQKTQNDAQYSAAHFEIMRPPSNFVRRSPIPSLSTPRRNAIKLNSEPSAPMASGKELKLPRVEEMKLPELKQLAKSRGIKGYSKLKKGELLELLKF